MISQLRINIFSKGGLMSLQTNLRGRLRNTSLPKKHGFMPVFEAIVNSIHAIEEKGSWNDQDRITLSIHRTSQISLNIEAKPEKIIGFSITDTGCGFDDTNFNSFETLDSEHKIDKGCRGVGRLLWLKVFDRIEVESKFKNEQGKFSQRHFSFNDSGVHGNKINSYDGIRTTGTIIKLDGFDESYRKEVPAKAKLIAYQLLEHCLWYFVRGEGIPEIIIEDGSEEISLRQLYNNHMHATACSEKIKISDHIFELTHIKFYDSVNKKHQISLCAANRLVKKENIHGKIPGLYAKICDESGEFTYTCYVSSEYLDKHVRSERTSFDIADNLDGIFEETEISMKLIRESVLERIKIHLQDLLSSNINAGKKRIDDFISTQAPRYRPIVTHVPTNELIIDPEKSDREVELYLHEKWYAVERHLLNEGHNIMEPINGEHIEDYKIRLQEYIQKVGDLKKSDLANYLCHRKIIIDILQKSIKCLDNGKYVRENIIHDLIMPMGKDSTEVFLDSCNLWLINERLAFHDYLASDKAITSTPITASKSVKKPDLVSLKIFDNPMLVNPDHAFPMATLTVIEIKRPMRNDISEGENKNPIEQCLSYLRLIREGKAKTKSGALIPRSESIPGYCYILCDLTQSMIDRCEYANFTMTADGMGYFGYNKHANAYFEVISFNQLVRSAKERNQAFFDKLGFPMVET